jgi:hypothetical protein
MTTITFRSPVQKPLLRAGTPKPVPPDPRAYDTFRITQQFDDQDSYWAAIDAAAGRTPRTHQATDIGNFTCGDPVVAMAPGVATRVKDNATALGAASDALGVRIDHGSGISTEYWHLARQVVADGQRVAAGQQIGTVGNTGLKAVCHTHIEAKRNGVKFDPEPLMFGGSVSTALPDTAMDAEEDDVYAWHGRIRPQLPKRMTIREGATTLDAPDDVTPFELDQDRKLILVGELLEGPTFWVYLANTPGRFGLVRKADIRVGDISGALVEPGAVRVEPDPRVAASLPDLTAAAQGLARGIEKLRSTPT